MIISYTAMSKNTGPEELSASMAALSGALNAVVKPDADTAIILARVVRGVSSEDWDEIRQSAQIGEWHAFPLDPESIENVRMADGAANDSGLLPVSPFREVRGALTSGMFLSQINSELARLGRNGGCMSIVSAGLANKKSMAIALGEAPVSRLESILGNILLSMLESCDSLGLLRPGQFGCCLPGLGQLGARHFAEKAQSAFEDAARPFFPCGGISAGGHPTCAVGIVNLVQGESANCASLIKRAKTALEVALAKDECHIHQETTFTPLDGATLVQSSEKRFLFFGGDQ